MTELLVVVTIIGMIALFAIPTMQRARVKSATNQGLQGVARAIDLARTEAIKRHSPVSLIVDTAGKAVRVWEDFNPADPAAVTNGDGHVDAGETPMLEHRLDVALEGFVTSHPADTAFATWRSDGSRVPGGNEDIQILDRKGNLFRFRVNSLTGSWRLEMKVGSADTDWTPRRESWTWKY